MFWLQEKAVSEITTTCKQLEEAHSDIVAVSAEREIGWGVRARQSASGHSVFYAAFRGAFDPLCGPGTLLQAHEMHNAHST